MFSDKANQQQFQNQKYDVITNYELDSQSQLHCTLKTAEERPQMMICTYDFFKHIVYVHHSVVHADISLTYKKLICTVYEIFRDDVQ